MNRRRHNWFYNLQGSRTITLKSTYKDFNDFADKSGIDPTDEMYKKVFNTLYGIYGDTYTRENSRDYLHNVLRFKIEESVKVYNKTNEIFDTQIERLTGEYEEINQFRMGDILMDPENFDKYKSARQTKLKSNADDILKSIKELMGLKSPFENLIQGIALDLFYTSGVDDLI